MRKKILSLVLAIVIMIAIVPSICVSAYSTGDDYPTKYKNAALDAVVDEWNFYNRECTSFVAWCLNSRNGVRFTNQYLGASRWGHAKTWGTVAASKGVTVDKNPAVGSVAWWNTGTYGHVAWVRSVNGNYVTIEEYNWATKGGYGERTIKTSAVSGGFIHIKDLEAAATIEPIHQDTTAHVRNGFFTLKNVASGKYMNVNAGKDANKTPVDMWAYDDSTDQQFNVVHKGNGKYKLYAVCSNNGTNRVVDVYRNGAAPAAGQVVDLWTPDDDTAQLFYIVPLDDGSYVFELAAKDGYVIAPKSASAAGTNGSQLTLQQYTGANYQKWKFCNNNGKETYPAGSYSVDKYTVNTGGATLTMRSGAETTASKVTSVPDGTVLDVTKISGNWGYTTYGKYSGWVCLDYTVYSPSITKITVENMLSSYFTGDELDLTAIKVEAVYSNGTSQIVTNGFTTEYDFSTAGTKTVTIEYEGFTTSFEVEVIEPGTATVTVVTDTSDSGKEVVLTVNLTEAINVYDGNFNIVYDNSVLKYKSYDLGSVLLTQNTVVNEAYDEDIIRVTFAGTDEVAEGKIIDVIFEVVAEDKCETEIEVQDVNLYSDTGHTITAKITNAFGTVEVDPRVGNYTVVSLTGKAINGSFYAETEITKNTDRDAVDTIVIAVYKDNVLIDRIYMRSKFAKGQSVVFGGYLEGVEGATFKAFVWDSMTSMNTLSNVIEK